MIYASIPSNQKYKNKGEKKKTEVVIKEIKIEVEIKQK